jgi:hypothetical protein
MNDSIPGATDSPASPINASSGSVANSVATATLPAVAGKTNFLSGLDVTGSGASAASVITGTISGIVGGPLAASLVVTVWEAAFSNLAAWAMPRAESYPRQSFPSPTAVGAFQDSERETVIRSRKRWRPPQCAISDHCPNGLADCKVDPQRAFLFVPVRQERTNFSKRRTDSSFLET